MQPQANQNPPFDASIVSNLAFSDDGQFCAAVSNGYSDLIIYRVNDLTLFSAWTVVRKKQLDMGIVMDIAFSSKKSLAICGQLKDKLILKYGKDKNNKNNWYQYPSISELKLGATCLSWSASGDRFASGSICGTLAVYQTNDVTMLTEYIHKAFNKEGAILAVVYHPKQVDVIAIGTANGSVILVSAELKQQNMTFKELSRIEPQIGWINHLSFQDEGQSLVVLPQASTFHVYTVKQNLLVSPGIAGRYMKLPCLNSIMRADKTILAGSFEGKVGLYSLSGAEYKFTKFLGTEDEIVRGQTAPGQIGVMKRKLELEGQKGVNSINRAEDNDHQNVVRLSKVGNVLVTHQAFKWVKFWKI